VRFEQTNEQRKKVTTSLLELLIAAKNNAPKTYPLGGWEKVFQEISFNANGMK
jgi:hypothetical protein